MAEQQQREKQPDELQAHVTKKKAEGTGKVTEHLPVASSSNSLQSNDSRQVDIPSMKDVLNDMKLIRLRMDSIRLRRADVQKEAKRLEDVLDGLFEYISEHDEYFQWENLNVGSYYEHLKVILN